MKLINEQLKYKQILEDFLVENESVLLNDWHHKVNSNALNAYNEVKSENGHIIFSILLNRIKGTISEKDLKQLAFKIAKEQIEANLNIGEFLYYINEVRQIVFNRILKEKFPSEIIYVMFDECNHYFDSFSYYLVTIYTNCKNELIEEKSLLISENYKDKMTLLGQISSSFVHEFRNPLTSIMGFNKLLKTENQSMKYLDIIDHELSQLNFRVTQFLHTSKAKFSEEKKVPLYVKDLIYEIQQNCFSNIIDSQIEVDIDISADAVVIVGRDGLKQVLLNLFINSIDALTDQETPRKIKVRSYIDYNKLIISISNNGPAIKREYLETIFEPFFTTKELGTGIGLYVCKKIIESSGGVLTCQSNENQTSFSIIFPENYFRNN